MVGASLKHVRIVRNLVICLTASFQNRPLSGGGD